MNPESLNDRGQLNGNLKKHGNDNSGIDLQTEKEKIENLKQVDANNNLIDNPLLRINSKRFQVDIIPDDRVENVASPLGDIGQIIWGENLDEERWEFPQNATMKQRASKSHATTQSAASKMIGNFFTRHHSGSSSTNATTTQHGKSSLLSSEAVSFENRAYKQDEMYASRKRQLRKQDGHESSPTSTDDEGSGRSVVSVAPENTSFASDLQSRLDGPSFDGIGDEGVTPVMVLRPTIKRGMSDTSAIGENLWNVTTATSPPLFPDGHRIVKANLAPTGIAIVKGQTEEENGILGRLKKAIGRFGTHTSPNVTTVRVLPPATPHTLAGDRGETLEMGASKTERPHAPMLTKKISTYETLPCVDHYKNALSFNRGRKRRPSLSQLHKGPLEPPNEYDEVGTEPYKGATHDNRKSLQSNKSEFIGPVLVQDKELGLSQGPKFGWIKGVMLRCILNIWGVMLFLRLSWIVGQAGIGYSSLIVLLSVIVTSITSMSMSAICTNGEVKGGQFSVIFNPFDRGAYYMISRSLGPEFGGAIGMVFSVASTIAVSMNVVGLAETVVDIMEEHAGHVFATLSPATWIRIIGCATAVLLLVVVIAGMEWEAKAQLGFLLLLLLAFFTYFLGTVTKIPEAKVAKGLLGYRRALFMENFFPAFQKGASFFSIFAIYFPSATGILAGANISGDLKDAQRSIPKGTLGAILITATSYLVMIWTFGSVMLREASGDIADLYYSYNPATRNLDAGSTVASMFIKNLTTTTTLMAGLTTPPSPGERLSIVELESPSSPLRSCGKTMSCKYGLLYDYQVAEMISYVGPIITAGIFSATLSSALACLVGASKVFQALCRDRLFPKIDVLAVGSKKNDEPIRIYLLSFTIAVLFILIGDLNIIAPIISNFYLMAYALINYSCFDASLSKSLGFRPGFKYFNPWVSLIGGLLCIISMFLIKWWATVITFIFIFGLYAYIRYKKPDVNWGSSTQAHVYRNALTFVYKLNQTEEHVKNFRPQILALTGDPRSRPAFLDFANLFTKNLSLLICGHVILDCANDGLLSFSDSSIYPYFWNRGIKALYNPIVAHNMKEGVRALLQLSGLGRLRPNIILMGFKHEWHTQPLEAVVDYFNIIHDAFDLRLCVGILRMPTGLCVPVNIGNDISNSDSSPFKPIHSDNTAITRSSKGPDHHPSSKAKFMNLGKNRNILGKKSVKIDSNKIEGTLKVSLTSAKRKISRGLHTYKLSRNPQAFYSNYFHGRHKKGTIDVWWLFDDGGLTILLPYILSQRRNWQNCKVRFFALSKDSKELDIIHHNFAAMLTKFRIDYSDIFVIPDIQKLPYPTSQSMFEKMVQPYRVPDENDPRYKPGMITDAEYVSLELKTFRHIRLQELLNKHSHEANLIVITLPIPRKGTCSAILYMAWLEIMTKNLPPILMVRGNQQSVLTFYS